jgi:hypothetical protein
MNRQELEQEIGLQIPEIFDKYSLELQSQIVEYLKQLDEIERKAYTIGIHHLGTSFNIVKSNGFNEWKNPKK